jgi:hypothetical protein
MVPERDPHPEDEEERAEEDERIQVPPGVGDLSGEEDEEEEDDHADSEVPPHASELIRTIYNECPARPPELSKILDSLTSNSPYAFIVVGAAWLGVVVLAGSALILWPVVALIAAGVQLKMWPSRRLTWAWAVSAAVLGFLLAAYQVYAWAGFLGGAFSGIAAVSLAGFAVLAAVHLVLLYAGVSKPRSPKAPES